MDTQIISPKYKLSSVEGEVKMLTAWGKTLPCSLVADTSVSLVSLLTLLRLSDGSRVSRLWWVVVVFLYPLASELKSKLNGD